MFVSTVASNTELRSSSATENQRTILTTTIVETTVTSIKSSLAKTSSISTSAILSYTKMIDRDTSTNGGNTEHEVSDKKETSGVKFSRIDEQLLFLMSYYSIFASLQFISVSV